MQRLEKSAVDALNDDPTFWQTLRAHRFITEDGFVYALACKRWGNHPRLSVLIAALLADNERLPPHHHASITADRYFNDDQQQLGQQVIFYDGSGRVLQHSVRVEAGAAYQRKEDGTLSYMQPITLPFTATRWAVTGRKEYDNKGQTIRIYPPYYLNDWRYVRDDSAREHRVSDLFYYDPLGRENKVVTATGNEKRVTFFPWFSVQEDENDRAAER